MSNKQLCLLCAVIMFSVGSLFSPLALKVGAVAFLAYAAWGKP